MHSRVRLVKDKRVAPSRPPSTTREEKPSVTLAPRKLYLNGSRYLITLIDLERPDAAERLSRELAGWRGFVRTEELADDRVALLMRPGGALGQSR
jgi:hypothetical protein